MLAYKTLALLLALLLGSTSAVWAKGGGGRGGGGKSSPGLKAPAAPKAPSAPRTPSPKLGPSSPRLPKTYVPKTYSSKPKGKYYGSSSSPQGFSETNTKVHDGDTFYANGQKYRVRGIDTPELGQPKSEAAKQRLGQLLSSGQITTVPRAVDKYGRTVADVYVNGRNVADVMKAEGLAK